MSNDYSEFLRFERKSDLFEARAADSLDPQLAFLRLEFFRARPGMQDYLIRVASPKNQLDKKTNTIITLHANRRQTSNGGIQGTARVIVRTMKEKGDTTFDWSKIDMDHLTKMIAPAVKFFSANIAAEKMQWVTEALR